MKFSDIFAAQDKLFPNGLKASVIRMNGADAIHEVALGKVLYEVIAQEARAHGETFNGIGFNNVLSAVKSNEVQAYFIVVTEDNEMPKIVGGAIQFPTVFTEWDGEVFNHHPAVYSEDTYVSQKASTAFREKTVCSDFPEGIGLGTIFVCERIRRSVLGDINDLPFGLTARSRVAEHAQGNKQITSIYKKLNAIYNDMNDNNVLYFNGLPRYGKGFEGQAVLLGSLSSKGKDQIISTIPNVFVASWSSNGGREKIIASFTRAISTFTGETSVRVQFTTNGKLPDDTVLKRALGSLLNAGVNEIMMRGWIKTGCKPP